MIMLLLQFVSDSALNRAMSGGHMEVVHYLLSKGAKVNVCNIYTAVHTAICCWPTKGNREST